MAESRKTVYTVFKEHKSEVPVKNDDGAEPATTWIDAWTIVGDFEAYNPLDAKMQAAEKHGTGNYGATPAGSWKTKPLNVGQKAVVEVAEAG